MRPITLAAAACTLALLGSAHADPVPGQGTWETVLHARDLNADGVVDAWYDSSRDRTWLADADPLGLVTWWQARDWAAALVVHGVGGWRLPAFEDIGEPGCWGYTYDGSGDCGYNSNTDRSELAHMWHTVLGNLSWADTSGNGPQPGWGLTNTGPFAQLRGSDYWTATTDVSDSPWAPGNPDYGAWLFHTQWGYHDSDAKAFPMHVWVLRDGDVAPIPEPGTWALLAAGLTALGLRRRRRVAAALGAAALALPLAAVAAPVVQDSTYSVLLWHLSDRTAVGGIVFDGTAQNVVHRVTAADGGQRDVGVVVTESQEQLAGGIWRIRIALQADADLFPWSVVAGLAYGTIPDEPLQLDGHWRLLTNVLTVSADDQVLHSRDYQPAAANFGQADPWRGYFLSPDHYLGLAGVSGVGANRILYEMQVAAVPEPASAALVLLALAAAGGSLRRGRTARARA